MARRPAFQLTGETIAAGTRRTVDLPVSEQTDDALTEA